MEVGRAESEGGAKNIRGGRVGGGGGIKSEGRKRRSTKLKQRVIHSDENPVIHRLL
jgi:hypothetical protein